MYLIALTLPHFWDLHQQKKNKRKKSIYQVHFVLLICSLKHGQIPVAIPWKKTGYYKEWFNHFVLNVLGSL